MKKYSFTYKFKAGQITVQAFNSQQGRILAQAVAIRNGWDYTIIE